MQDGEMDVLEQYAEMCRYQNKQRGKPEEDSLENEQENENGENKTKTENAEKEKNLEKLMITLIQKESVIIVMIRLLN